ncbi:MAG: hypothetical protein EBV06_01380 [Planctomycetia bacterium]|nr:hypothetical protein [Planctomycetia bacterium]
MTPLDSHEAKKPAIYPGGIDRDENSYRQGDRLRWMSKTAGWRFDRLSSSVCAAGNVHAG